MAAHQKKTSRLGAHLVFVDESGFLLIPSVCKTWAPCGQTPLLYHRQRRDRISVISGISVSPRRRRLGLYSCLHAKNIQHPEVRAFLRYLLRHLRGPVVLVWDNGSIHKGDAIRALCHAFPRLHLYRFPGYAPELNPDEGVWKLAKQGLANGRPDTQRELWRHLRLSLDRIRLSPQRLRGCIRQSDLPPFLGRL
ncbi:MAG: IS630 family transposase [Thermoanaerobaculia bacterium]